MITMKYFIAASVVFLAFTTCGDHALASTADASASANATASKDALVSLEKSAYEAWKSHDTKFWNTFLSDRFVGYGSSGKLDKATATVQYTGADCEIRSYSLSDEQARPLGTAAMLITHKTTVDGTCSGQKVPAASWAASVYVRDGTRWKGAFHAEAPIVDPKTGTVKPVGKNDAAKRKQVKIVAGDRGTAALHKAEKAVWEAWREHDTRKMAALTAADISFINIFGIYLPNKADALKDWSGTGCEVKSVSVTNAIGTMLSPSVGILTFDGAADGTCYGQKVGPIWGTSIYVKDGPAWKWTFGINLPAPEPGA